MLPNVILKINVHALEIMGKFAILQAHKLIVSLITQIQIYVILKMEFHVLIMVLDGISHMINNL
jgi:hypothetical protein